MRYIPPFLILPNFPYKVSQSSFLRASRTLSNSSDTIHRPANRELKFYHVNLTWPQRQGASHFDAKAPSADYPTAISSPAPTIGLAPVSKFLSLHITSLLHIRLIQFILIILISYSTWCPRKKLCDCFARIAMCSRMSANFIQLVRNTDTFQKHVIAYYRLCCELHVRSLQVKTCSRELVKQSLENSRTVFSGTPCIKTNLFRSKPSAQQGNARQWTKRLLVMVWCGIGGGMVLVNFNILCIRW